MTSVKLEAYTKRLKKHKYDEVAGCTLIIISISILTG